MWVLQLFQGYTPVTFLVVANLALSGLLVSWIMKFADSIMKVGMRGSSTKGSSLQALLAVLSCLCALQCHL